MANRNERLAGNAAGRFYVDASCVDCDMCRGIAPGVFARDDDVGLSVVARQPRDADEERLAREAVESCPSESIGWDG